jgi:hypothetical protein
MRKIFCIVSIAVLIGSFGQRQVAAAIQDPLLIVDLKKEPNYRKVWTSKLQITPFDCGRLVVLPPFEPEMSISIYCRKTAEEQRSYHVTYIAPETNIWQASDGMRHPQRAQAVGTRRIDAEIPESTALLLRKLWLRMLTGIRHSAADIGRSEVVPMDAATLEWSLERRSDPPLRGN